METTLKTRLLDYLKFKGYGQNFFEKKAGLSIGFISKIGDRVGLDNLLKILDAAPELNRDWLFFGEGEMLNTSQNVGDINNSNVSGVNVHGNDIQINPNAYDTLLQIVQTFQHSTTKSQEQIDRLITLLEKKYG